MKDKHFHRLMIAILIIIILSPILLGAFYLIAFFIIPPKYGGSNPQLFTEAVYSILSINGYGFEGQDPVIRIVERDDEGRILFTYSEDDFRYDFYLLILQKSDEEYSYYYPDFNYIATDNRIYSDDPKEMVNASFTQKQIEELKEVNDWDEEFDESKCIKTKITRHKEQPKISRETEKQLDSLCKSYVLSMDYKLDSSVYRYSTFCTYDDYGRMLYYVCGSTKNNQSEYIYFNFAIIFNADWSYDSENTLLLLTGLDYRADLKQFKRLHDWNNPYQTEA